MRNSALTAFILIFLIINSSFAGDSKSSVIDKDILFEQVKALKEHRPSRAVAEYEGLPLKSGSRLGFALLSLEDEIEPRLLKQFAERPLRQAYLNTEHFKIHYDTVGVNAVPLADIFPDGPNGIPDYIDSTALISEYVWHYEIDTLGFIQPVSDGYAGGDSRYDIYLTNIGSFGYYGVTYPDTKQPDGRTYSSFIELENDYYEFPLYGYRDNPIAAVKVTAAHEFFHAIHYSIDAYEEEVGRYWWYEVTAVWMEDVVFDEVDDYIYYLRYFFNYPWLSLASYSVDFSKPEAMHPYASCIWAIYLDERFGRDIIRQIWEICGFIPNYNVLPATEVVLNIHGSSFEEAFSEFTTWNYCTGHRADTVNKYSEADHWGWINPYNQQFEDTITVRFFTKDNPTQYDSLNPVDTSFSAQDFTPKPLSANYLVFSSPDYQDFPMGGLHFDFRGGNIMSPDNIWNVAFFGWDPAQDTLIPFNIDSSSGEGLAVFRDWSRFDHLVVIPSVFGYTYSDNATAYSITAYYDNNLTGDSPILFNILRSVEVKAGACAEINLIALDPNNDSIYFETDPPLDSIAGMSLININRTQSSDTTILDTTTATLQYCPDYDMVDSTLSIVVFARDTLEHYDAKQIHISIVYFDPEITAEKEEAIVVAYPNPFIYENDISMTFRYYLPDSVEYYSFPDSNRTDNIELYIFTAAGDQVFRTNNIYDGVIEWLPSGEFSINWDVENNSGDQLAGGIYIVKLRAGDKTATGKFVIIK